MADAAQIGATASSYEGSAALGGGSFGSVQLDVRPIMQLAQYTFLYNRSEYDQRQKDVEKAAEQIADLTAYDLTTSIPKDSKILQDKWEAITEFVRQNPDAINYRNREKWLEYNKMKGDLANDLAGAKKRDTLYQIRLKEISDEPIEGLKAVRKEALDKEVNGTDIRTSLQHTHKYDISIPEIPKAGIVSFDVYRKGPNQDYQRDFSLFNVKKARAVGNIFSLELNQPIDESTQGGKEKAITRRNNFWIKGTEQFNQALDGYMVGGVLDEAKVKGLAKDVLGLVKKTNEYLAEKSAEIKAGVYTDQFGKKITFGEGMLDEEDYRQINYADGLSPDELALVAQYAQWQGDSYKTKAIQTDDQNQAAARANQMQMNRDDNAGALERTKITAGASSGTGTTIGQDEPERRVQDFVSSYNESKPSGSNKVLASQLDEYTRSVMEIKPTQFVVIDGENVLIYSKETDATPVRRIKLDGIKSKVSDSMLPNRTKGEEKIKFGGISPKAEDKWGKYRVNK